MPLIVQRASAGSGKTEQLARRYLQILLAPDHAGYPIDPATILAATFTREAAGEIIARIFRMLALACNEEQARQKIAEGTTLPAPTRAECQQLLRRLVERVHRLSIGTIDALFARQARSLALDLGLAPAWEVATGSSSAMMARKTMLRLLEEDSLFAQEWKTLHHFRRRLSFVEEAAVLLEKNRFVATFTQPPELAGPVKAMPPKHLSIKEATGILEFLQEFKTPSTAQGKPSGHWTKALQKLEEAFSQALYLKDILSLGSLLTQCLESEPSFFSKPIPEEFLAIFSPLAEASRKEQERLMLLREAALHRLAKRYEQLRKKISFQAGSYTFSEIEEVIVAALEELLEIEFRMEARTEHLLLDEYQDTSQRQHDFLSPLIGNVLAKGGHAFVVGDVKQGIYGWRGGKRHLLGLLEEEYEMHVQKTEPLSQSYRSSQAVLDAVNEVFGALKNKEALGLMNADSSFEKSAARWSADFQPQLSAASASELRGAVLLHEVAVEKASREEAMQEVVKKVVELVEAHHNEDPSREIAILVRRTKFIPQLILALRHRGILASGEGGNSLADTMAVEVLLSLLSSIDHPGNSAAYEHVRSSPLAEFLKKNASVLRERLLDYGYAKSLRSWSSHPPFQKACTGYEKARIEGLIAMAHRFDAGGGGTPSDFVKQVREERVESPLSRGVRVLSMHAAKGLEFESVILMDLDTDIFASVPEVLRVRTLPEGNFFIQSNQEQMALLGRGELLETLKEEQWAEALSLLYVGMTRAISYLDLVVLNAEASSKKSMAQWLRASGLKEHHLAGASWREKKSQPPSAVASITQREQPLLRTIPKLSKRSPSDELEGGLVSLAQKFQETTTRDQGIAQHALLAEILWLEHRLPSGLSSDSKLFRRFQTDPELASVFQEQHFLTQWNALGVTKLEVWRERRFAVVLDDGKKSELLTGAFDRVVIGFADRAIVAQIIDFKTDPLSQEKREKNELTYRPQLEAYCTALQKLLPSLEKIESKIVWI